MSEKVKVSLEHPVKEDANSGHVAVLQLVDAESSSQPPTWRTIPVSKWLITMVSKSPNWGYSPYKWPKWLINRGY